jgi:hypothetical protein
MIALSPTADDSSHEVRRELTDLHGSFSDSRAEKILKGLRVEP